MRLASLALPLSANSHSLHYGYQFNLRVESHRTTSHQRSQSNLPNLWTELIGRDVIIEDLLRDIGTQRFVTIVGSGGIGKTTVAIAVAQRASEMFKDGAMFVDFTTLKSQPMLVNRIASALRLPVPSTSREVSVLNWLQDRNMLLILDNCEHVLEASAFLVEEILRSCPGVPTADPSSGTDVSSPSVEENPDKLRASFLAFKFWRRCGDIHWTNLWKRQWSGWARTLKQPHTIANFRTEGRYGNTSK
jgi:hypothetical protein